MPRKAIVLSSSMVLAAFALPLVAAPDPDIFDGRVAEVPAGDAGDPGDSPPVDAGEPDESGVDTADGTSGGEGDARDFESVGRIGGEPVDAAGSKEGSGDEGEGSGTSGSAPGGTEEGGVGGGSGGPPSGEDGSTGGAAGQGAGSGASDRDLEAFGVGATGAGGASTVEVNRSKAGLPSGGLPNEGTGDLPEDAQQGAAGTPASGQSDVDFGTNVPSGL